MEDKFKKQLEQYALQVSISSPDDDIQEMNGNQLDCFESIIDFVNSQLEQRYFIKIYYDVHYDDGLDDKDISQDPSLRLNRKYKVDNFKIDALARDPWVKYMKISDF